MTLEERNEIVLLYEDGMNPEDIAEEFGFDETEVMDICAEIL